MFSDAGGLKCSVQSLALREVAAISSTSGISFMRQLIKSLLGIVADWVNLMRGYQFPKYFTTRDRIHVMLRGIEPDISRFFRANLRPGMTVLDVGANVGLICRICADCVGPSGRVVAFEPDPYTRRFLEFNVRRHANVTVSPIALSDQDGVTKLHLHPHSGTANSLVNFDPAAEVVQVDCRTIDSFLEAHPEWVPDFIKIDVEGAEPKVLAGMRRTVQRLPRVALVIEFCPANLANGGYEAGEFFDKLDELGLVVEMIGEDGRTAPVADLKELMNRLGGEIYCNLLGRRKV